jgi:putative two-component system response regulator
MNNTRKKILLVDDNAAILAIGKNLLKNHYEVYPLPSAAKLFEILEKVLPDLILLDIKMPVMDGYETIKKLKSVKRFADIPVIFLTAKSDEASELQGFGLGAVDYISKPFSPPLLMKRIENQITILQQRQTIQQHADNLMDLVQKKTRDIFNLQNAILSTVADLVEFRDAPTGGHTIRTQRYFELMIVTMINMGIHTEIIRSWDFDFLLPSAQLHDVGKIAVPDIILNKPGKLDTHEFDVMKTHVAVGVDAIKRIIRNAPDHAFLNHALNIVGTHHEKWDGTGYPAGLKELEIPIEGRIMAIADVYDALTSWRPYKKAFTHQEAKKIIEDEAGKHFEPALVEVFKYVEREFKDISSKNNGTS